MTALPERRRRRTIAMVLTTVAVMVVGPLLGYVGVRAVLESTGGKDALADNLPVQQFPVTPSSVLFTTDDAGVLAGVTVFVLSPNGSGGSIVPVAVNADTGYAPESRRSLQQVFAEEGPEAALFEVESLLLLSVDHWDVADPAELEQMLTPFAPYRLTLVSPVDVGTGEDESATIEAGPVVVDAATAAAVLTAGAGLGDESVRVGNAEAVWSGFAESVGAGRPLAVPPVGVPADFAQFVERLVAAPVQSRGIAFFELTGDENPDGLDVVHLDQSDVVFVFASIAPGSMSAVNLGPMIRLEAPPGYDAEVKQTIAALLFVQGNVVSVDTSGPLQAETVFLVPDDADRLNLAATDGIFGDVTFGEPTVRIAGVTVTIVLGTDYLDSVTTYLESVATT